VISSPAFLNSLVIDSRYRTPDTSQVLTRAGQLKQCGCGLFFQGIPPPQNTCVYTSCSPLLKARSLALT
jgi:hypothetical protein